VQVFSWYTNLSFETKVLSLLLLEWGIKLPAIRMRTPSPKAFLELLTNGCHSSPKITTRKHDIIRINAEFFTFSSRICLLTHIVSSSFGSHAIRFKSFGLPSIIYRFLLRGDGCVRHTYSIYLLFRIRFWIV